MWKTIVKTIVVSGLVLCLIGIAVADQLATADTEAAPVEEAPKIGYLAPAFQLETLDGGKAGIERGGQGKGVIINFWASWCDPCRLEAPFLAEMYEKYSSDLDIYGVNGTQYDDMDSVRAFVNQYKYTFPILLDKESKVFKLYKVPGYPTSIFIDRNGVIRDIVIGLPGHEEYEGKIKNIVNRQ